MVNPPEHTPFIVGHRGASYDAPENTLPSFQKAWEDGADAIEGDFHLTADGEIVCIHDATTGRVSSENLIVKESTLAALQTLDVGAWKGEQWKGTKIPTISEVLATVPDGKKIYVEIKSGIKIIPKLLEAFAQSGLSDEQIVVISFDPEVIKVFKEQRPTIRANWLLVIDELVGGGISMESWLVIQMIKTIGANGISTNYHHVNQKMVEDVLNAGFEFHVWTVNDSEKAKNLLEMGVQSITTDMPGTVLRF